MKTTCIIVDTHQAAIWPLGRVNMAKLDTTTENDIAQHKAQDDAESHLVAGRYAQRVRKRLGLTQREFSQCIDVPLDTIRNWEQGKRELAGPAKALLRILDKSPELALACLAT